MRSLERAAYRAHWQSKACQSRLDKARSVIAAHPSYALNTSWGKDSMAMMLLALEVRPRIKALNAAYPNPAERFADINRVRDAFLERWGARIEYVEVAPPGEWEMYERAGFFSNPETPEQRAAVKWWKDGFLLEMRRGRDALGADGAILGLRAEESRARRLNAYVHGSSYVKRDGDGIALPMSFVTARDVWAVLVRYDAAQLRIYEVAPDRETARSGFVFATGGADAIRRHGAWSVWAEAYPVEFGMWLHRFPEMRAMLT